MNYKEEYRKWLESTIVDEKSKSLLRTMDEKEIEESFYKNLEFGTGGLRGIMGVGSNRLNVYTVRKASQGIASEIVENGEEAMKKGVVIAYDSRNNSRLFAIECARVFCANGIKTHVFESLRPTPELSFAVRHLGCARGVVITASHNTKEYNGYKVYGTDGGQIPPSVAEVITKYINKTDIFDDVKICDKPQYISVGETIDNAYMEAVMTQAFNIDIPENFKVVYTPLHGSGNLPVRKILSEIGVKNVFVVPQQEMPDGNFPTVKSPNPENHEAFLLAIEYANELQSDIIIGTDPDSDRVGVAVKDNNGQYRVLTGNQTGALLCDFILKNSTYDGGVIVKTIVTTEMVRKIAESYNVETVDVLTGFKFIGEKIKEYEKEGRADKFIFGLEESYGYLKGTYARDKDAVVAVMLICQCAAKLKMSGMNMYDALEMLYKKYGYYKEALQTKTLEGIDGAKKIKTLMKKFRTENLPLKVNKKLDYLHSIDGLPQSNVMKFVTDYGWFAVRPSGTEQKIKSYFGVVGDSHSDADNKLDFLMNAVNEFMER